MRGPIPPELDGLTSLERLNLSGNRLSGRVPELYVMSRLVAADISGNQLRGDIPLGERRALITLYKATDGPNCKNNSNWLTDAPLEDWYGVNDIYLFPVQCNNSGVYALTLAGNNLSGPIPHALGTLMLCLEHLDLSRNNLVGEIPPELGELGNYPTTMRGFFEHLNLWGNELIGEIPTELPGLLRTHAIFEYPKLGGNELTGGVPSAFSPYLRRSKDTLDLPFCQ